MTFPDWFGTVTGTGPYMKRDQSRELPKDTTPIRLKNIKSQETSSGRRIHDQSFLAPQQ